MSTTTPVDAQGRVQVSARIPLRVVRALGVYCALARLDQRSVVSLALERYLAQAGPPEVLSVLEEGAEA